MKQRKLLSVSLAMMILGLYGCENVDSLMSSSSSKEPASDNDQDQQAESKHQGVLVPDAIDEIPASYFDASDQPGTLRDLDYDTWESFTYEEHEERLSKHAVVYLPYGYDENQQYDVFYLMHGGWSNETTVFGIADPPNVFKNVMDHAIASGEIKPLIIVCPTYNNTNVNGQDSDNFSLA